MHSRIPIRLAVVAVLGLALTACQHRLPLADPQRAAVTAQRNPMTVYVATTGNNADAGTIGAPWRTLNYAGSRIAAGDTVLVRGGTYQEGLSDAIPSGTSWANKVRIAAYLSETVWLAPTSGERVVYFSRVDTSYIEFDGINLNGAGISDATVFFDDRVTTALHHIRFKNAEVRHRNDLSGGNTNAAILMGGHDNEFINLNVHGIGGPYGFYVHGDRNLIEGCEIHDTATAFVQVYHNPTSLGYTGPPNGNIVRNNYMHDIATSNQWGVADGRQWGIIIYGAVDTQAYNNVITKLRLPYLPGNAAVAVLGSGSRIWHNTVIDNLTEGISIGSGSSDTEVKGNIVYLTSGFTFQSLGSGTVQANNLFGVNPQLVDPAGGNFHLQASSPAVNAGATISSVSTDLAGVTRPQGVAPDIGAYEYVIAGPVPAAPTGLRVVPR